MAKDPYNPTVKAFKKNGLLEEILYPDGRPEGRSNDRCARVLCVVLCRVVLYCIVLYSVVCCIV